MGSRSVPLDAHYTDPLLVSLYDAENSGRDDTDFYLRLAAGLEARTVVDIGCGTGVLAVDLARDGRAVVGVDPAGAMLDVARARPDGDLVTWVEGTADDLVGLVPPGSVDLVVMTGHVAQVFLTDDDWAQVLEAAARLLGPGGHLAFETRDPAAAAWDRWIPELTHERVVTDDGSTSTSWVEVTSVDGGLVTFDGHTVLGDGVDRVSSSTLRFRDQREVLGSVERAGFEQVTVHGGWTAEPVGPGTTELVVVATAPRQA